MKEATASSQSGDTYRTLAETILGPGYDFTSLGGKWDCEKDTVVPEAQEVDVTPLLRALEVKMRDNVVEATTKFNAEFKGSRTGTDADSVLQFFDDGFDDFGNVLGTDCSGAIYLLFKKAIIDIYGSSKFDAMYGASTIKFTGRTGAVAPGDWVVFRNTGDYGIKHNSGSNPWGEDNTICVAEEKYWGQGLPGTGKATAARN